MKTLSSRSAVRPLLPLADYQRIFRVIHSVLDSVDADIPAASFFFSVTAAQILKQFYKMNAYPVAGAAFYLVSKDGAALSFGEIEADKVGSNSDAFHCWVQCEGVLFDFMAPVFQELLAAAGHPLPLPRQMLQRDLARMCASSQMLAQPGDFYLEPNFALTKQLLQQFMGKPALNNLSQVCVDWYRKPPKPLAIDLVMRGADGDGNSIQLSKLQMTGAW